MILGLFVNEKTKNMLFYKGLKLYNQLPTEIKEEKNLKKFKSDIIKHVKANY